jgi:histone-lysine N-methyltransferase EZH2
MQSEAPDRSLNDMVTDSHVMIGEDNMRKEEFVDENICKQELTDNKSWNALEKGLLEKGMEIFGKNRSDMFELEMCFFCLY